MVTNLFVTIFCYSKVLVEEELIFNLEDYQTIDSNNTSPTSNQLNAQSVRHRPKSPQKNRFNPIKQSHVSCPRNKTNK